MNVSRFSSRFILAAVVVCFILSGFAALLYQTAWLRQFSLVFGTSELAVAAVLSAYMGGLSLGASLAARYIHKITKPVLFYGVLELGIALSALAVPLFLKFARLMYVSIFGGQPEPVDASGLGQSSFYVIFSFLVLAIPTTLMGATLPLLTKYVVESKEQVGSRVGLLYAANTLGAVGGTATAGFLLLPLVGLNGTVWTGVSINLIVFVLVVGIVRLVGPQAVGGHSDLRSTNAKDRSAGESVALLGVSGAVKNRFWILPLMLFSGANSFVYEVLWTRLLGHILGGSITAFATMLAGFLSGIAIGSGIAARFAKTREQAAYAFVLIQCGIAITSILLYRLLPLALPETAGLEGNIPFAIFVLLPATIFIGATFPAAVRILASDETDAATASARVYSWNTVGAIFGATLAAFFLIPLLKYEGTVRFAVLVNVFLALAAVILFCFRRERVFSPVVLFTSIFLLGALVFYKPSVPESILRSSPILVDGDGEMVFYEVGRSATVTILDNEGQFFLRTNGLPEASASTLGSPPDRQNQLLLSVLPVLARPDAENMLVVGLGAGVALESVPASVKSIDVVELEKEVVEANRFIGDERRVNPLKDARVNITINDARSALALMDKRYDAIVSQPSHPWTAGASHLYTKEFMELARDRLTENGVYLQWMNSRFVDEFLLRSLAATMLEVFPHVRMYQFHPGVLFFLGSGEPLAPEKTVALTGRPLSDDVLGYLELGVGSVEDLLIALSMEQAGMKDFAKSGKVITDNNNEMATRSSQVMSNGGSLNPEELYSLIRDYDPLLSSYGKALRADLDLLDYPYIGRRLSSIGMRKRALDISSRLAEEDNSQSLVMIGLGLQQQGEREESEKNLRIALERNPTDQQARYALLQPWFGSIFGGRDVPSFIDQEMERLTGTALDTVNALIAVEDQDMNRLVELDAALASVLSTDLWYTTSVKLRAEWRTRITSPGYQPRMANEATYLLDSAVSLYQDIQLYILRVKSTLIAKDYVSTLGTVRSIVGMVKTEIGRAESGTAAIGQGTINLRVGQLQELQLLLTQVARSEESMLASVESLSLDISEIIERLRSLLSAVP